ncbi:hypothetical protein LVY65_04535 [Sphingomonas sp. G124]|uniref:HPr kinase/phosphorylase C-terminal domain-containing protein n=1 Tax=Sphingomonas cremea TaxID=2904799 RepID=A0A9X1QIF1_9SPHN|nr:hypothetical protein [Sphingomonas cremea]MCF2514333.1 hypothetical protein [Sphingomonas cremea]
MGKQIAYSAFGLAIRSDIELPELFPSQSDAVADVVIALGAVPAPERPDTDVVVNGEGVFLYISGVARYWIRDGLRILIEPEPGVPQRNVRLFLLGSAMGVLLLQRGHLPLHANAVEIEGKAFAFMGGSGSGKSTLAASLHDRGHRVIADDVCVVRFGNNDAVFACPGIPRLRLWERALNATGRDPAVYERSYAGDAAIRKFDVPVANEMAAGEALPLAGLFILATGDEFEISRLSGLEAAELVYANTYRGKFVALTGTATDHWRSAIRLINSTPIFRFERRWGFDEFDEQLSKLLRYVS